MRILNADDVAENRYLLEFTLRTAGHEVVSAARHAWVSPAPRTPAKRDWETARVRMMPRAAGRTMGLNRTPARSRALGILQPITTTTGPSRASARSRRSAVRSTLRPGPSRKRSYTWAAGSMPATRKESKSVFPESRPSPHLGLSLSTIFGGVSVR